MKKLNKKDIIKKLIEKKHLLSKYGVDEVGLFGSYSRDENIANSDIDILVNFRNKEKTYDNFLKTYELLEKTFLNRKVELVTKQSISKRLYPYIEKEIIYV